MRSSLAREFGSRFGTLLMVFGLLLAGLGAAMNLSRASHLNALETAEESADFDAGLVEAAPPLIEETGLEEAPVDPASDTLGEVLLTQELIARQRAARPSRITIPSVALDTGVVEVGWEARIVNGESQGNVWQTADYAAGLHRGSAGIGEAGNTVISGHNNVAGAVFENLHAVEKGELLYLEGEGERRAYRVQHKLIVREEGAAIGRRQANAQWIQPTEDERVTLVSCYPPWGNSHRVIVVAKPLADEDPGLTGDAAQ